MKVCGRCVHTWISVKDKPARCPNCGTYHWFGNSMTNTCNACGHTWFSRTGKPPLRCPKCKTRAWSAENGKAVRALPDTFDESSRKIVDMYMSGQGCIKIAMATGVALSEVINTVKTSLGETRTPRI